LHDWFAAKPVGLHDSFAVNRVSLHDWFAAKPVGLHDWFAANEGVTQSCNANQILILEKNCLLSRSLLWARRSSGPVNPVLLD
jgi:hypothetical protein